MKKEDTRRVDGRSFIFEFLRREIETLVGGSPKEGRVRQSRKLDVWIGR